RAMSRVGWSAPASASLPPPAATPPPSPSASSPIAARTSGARPITAAAFRRSASPLRPHSARAANAVARRATARNHRLSPGGPGGDVLGAGWKSPPAVKASDRTSPRAPGGASRRGQQSRLESGADGHSPDERERDGFGPAPRALRAARPSGSRPDSGRKAKEPP